MIKLLQFAFEGALIIVVAWLAYSQIARPLLAKTPVFPMFRRNRRNYERETEEVNEALAEKEKVRELNRKRRKLGAGNNIR